LSDIEKTEAIARAMAEANGHDPERLVYGGPIDGTGTPELISGPRGFLIVAPPAHAVFPLWCAYVPLAQAALKKITE
jgi:hypothetical protein